MIVTSWYRLGIATPDVILFPLSRVNIIADSLDIPPPGSADAPVAVVAPAAVPAVTSPGTPVADPWAVTLERFLGYKQTFDSISQFLPQGTVAKGMTILDIELTPLAEVVAPILSHSMLHQDILSAIWNLSDVEQDGTLSLPEFVVAMHLVTAAVVGVPVPAILPNSLVQSVIHCQEIVASTNSGPYGAPAATVC